MEKFWADGDKLVVAVSGGVDSMVLLDRLLTHLPSDQLIVAHVNHGMRERAIHDQQFVNTQTQHRSLLFETNDTLPTLKNEEEAREFRYQFLMKVAKKHGAKWIVTGHHQDDQIETVLWRIVRGDGVNSFKGIPTSRQIDDNVMIYRPLIQWSRKNILLYAKKHGLTWVEDETNSQLHYTRNRFRQQVVPLLKQENPQFDCAMVDLRDDMLEMMCYVDETLLNSPYVVDNQLQLLAIRQLPLSQQKLLVSRYLSRVKQPRKFVNTILKLVSQTNGQKKLSLLNGWEYVQTYDIAKVQFKTLPQTIEQRTIETLPHVVEGYVMSYGKQHGEVVLENELPLIVRSVQPGDKVSIYNGRKKVSRLFIDAKVPQDERLKIPVLATATGRVIAILDERFEYLSKRQETGKIDKVNQHIFVKVERLINHVT